MESFHPTHFTGFWAHLFYRGWNIVSPYFCWVVDVRFRAQMAGKTVSWESCGKSWSNLQPWKMNGWNLRIYTGPLEFRKIIWTKAHHFQCLAGGLSTIHFFNLWKYGLELGRFVDVVSLQGGPLPVIARVIFTSYPFIWWYRGYNPIYKW